MTLQATTNIPCRTHVVLSFGLTLLYKATQCRCLVASPVRGWCHYWCWFCGSCGAAQTRLCMTLTVSWELIVLTRWSKNSKYSFSDSCHCRGDSVLRVRSFMRGQRWFLKYHWLRTFVFQLITSCLLFCAWRGDCRPRCWFPLFCD